MNLIKNPIMNEENPKKKKLNKIIIFLIIGAIAFLVFGNFGNDEPDKKEMKKTFDLESYKFALKEEAEMALSQIKGAGKVKVILSFESLGKTVVARNNQSRTQTDTREDDNKETKEITDSVVVYGQGDSEKPYVTEEKMPVPSGVLVIAEGAGNETVRYELYEAVKALYGISSHRIKVTASGK